MATGAPPGLSVRVGTDLAALADDLAARLAVPTAEVLEPELVVVPTPGIGAWLAPRLAERLGARDGQGDGVCANVQLRLVGDLLRRLDAEDPDAPDAWSVGSMTVTALGALLGAERDGPLARLRDPDEDASAFAVARAAADLFDRLFRWRPDTADRWLAGDDEDPRAALLRELSARTASPPPHRALDAALWRLAGGDDGGLDLPSRVHLFGADTLAGGPRMPAVLDALGTTRAVCVHLVAPSVERFFALRAATPRFGATPPERRRDDDGGDALLRSWGTATGDAARLMAQLPERATSSVEVVARGAAAPASTLLGALQRTITGDAMERRAPDRTVTLHGCVGDLRQVEVLRDAVLGALADDPTLAPSDVVVLCADLPRFAPYVDAVLGDPQGAPALPYVLRDRAVSRAVPTVAGLDAGLRLLAGRVPRSEVLDFLRLDAVQGRFSLDPGDVDRIAAWSAATDVHWGLDGAQRSVVGLPPTFDAGTWRRALDRLLAGVALPEDHRVDALGLRAIDVGHSLARVGALCDAVDALGRFRAAASAPRPVSSWCGFAREVVGGFFSAPTSTLAANQALDELLESLERDATADATPVPFGEFRSLFADRAAQVRDVVVTGPGGMTVTSFAPLRNVPFRVVALLGVDEAALDRTRAQDVAFGPARVGDRDPRTELRAALLAAVLSARDRLLVTFEARDVVSNKEVTPATALAELLEAVGRALDGDVAALRRDHPRHGHGDADLLLATGPFSFDEGSLARALELRDPDEVGADFRARLDGGRPATSRVAAASLAEFLRRPQRVFLRETLGVRLPPSSRSPDDELPTSLDDLQRSNAVGALVEAGLHELDDEVDAATWEAFARAWAERPDGPLAALPGRLAARELLGRRAVSVRARELRRQVVTAWRGARELVSVEVPVGDEVVLADVEVYDGTRTVRWAPSTNEVRIRVDAMVDLLCLTAAHPEVRWRSHRIYRKGEKAECETSAVPGEDAADRQARAVEGLTTLLDLRRRGLVAPIPLFFGTAGRIFERLKPGRTAPSPAALISTGYSGWKPFHMPGDEADDAVRYCFDASYEELAAEPATADDPRARLHHGGSRLLAFTLALADGLCILDHLEAP